MGGVYVPSDKVGHLEQALREHCQGKGDAIAQRFPKVAGGLPFSSKLPAATVGSCGCC